MIDRHAGRRNLHQEFGQRVERHNIVHYAQDHDHNGAEENALGGAVDIAEDNGEKRKAIKIARPPSRGIGSLCIRRLSLGTSMAPTL